MDIDPTAPLEERAEARLRYKVEEALFHLRLAVMLSEYVDLTPLDMEAIRKAIAGEGRLVNVPFETSDGEVVGIAYLFDLLPEGETWAGKMFRQDQGGEDG